MISFPELSGRVGEVIGRFAPVTISQERVDAFADVTGDRQWIQVDPLRARFDGPYKSTVAHGALTPSVVGETVLNVYR